MFGLRMQNLDFLVLYPLTCTVKFPDVPARGDAFGRPAVVGTTLTLPCRLDSQQYVKFDKHATGDDTLADAILHIPARYSMNGVVTTAPDFTVIDPTDANQLLFTCRERTLPMLMAHALFRHGVVLEYVCYLGLPDRQAGRLRT